MAQRKPSASGRAAAKRPRRGAPKRGEPTARQRLVAVALELFYQQGIHAIGIEAVLERSGVSKSSLYRTFASKDELIAAVAQEQDRRFWQWWDAAVAPNAGRADKQIKALFGGLADLIASPGFRGCPFINLATEFPDSQHPGTMVACANKTQVRSRLDRFCSDLGVADPQQLGHQLALLMEGAYGMAATGGAANLKSVLVDGAQRLMDAHLHGAPK